MSGQRHLVTTMRSCSRTKSEETVVHSLVPGFLHSVSGALPNTKKKNAHAIYSFFQQLNLINFIGGWGMKFFLVFLNIKHLNIDCGSTLEPPRQGGSSKYPQFMFREKICIYRAALFRARQKDYAMLTDRHGQFYKNSMLHMLTM